MFLLILFLFYFGDGLSLLVINNIFTIIRQIRGLRSDSKQETQWVTMNFVEKGKAP